MKSIMRKLTVGIILAFLFREYFLCARTFQFGDLLIPMVIIGLVFWLTTREPEQVKEEKEKQPAIRVINVTPEPTIIHSEESRMMKLLK